jgi:hypothetical protein
LFVKDNKENKTYFIANALITDQKKDKLYDECLSTISGYENILKKKNPNIKKYKVKEQVISTDTEKEDFEVIIQNITQVSSISQECSEHAQASEYSANNLATNAETIAGLLRKFKV